MPEIIQWLDQNAVTTDLSGDSDSDFYVHLENSMGLRGMDMPVFQFIEDEIFNQPGAVLRTVKTKPRDVDLALIARGDDEATLAMNIRSLASKLNPTEDGYLIVTSADGTQRQLVCRYSAGFEGEQTLRYSFRTYRLVTLHFHAQDPYWQDLTDVVNQYNVNNQAAFLGTPFLPLHIAGSSISGTFTVTNMGDVPAYPVWVINGPGDGIVLTNDTTGESIDLTGYTLAAGHYIQIDTRPLIRTVLLDGVTNLYSSLVGTPSLWALQPGDNSVTLDMTSITNASYISASYRQKYLTK